MTTRTAALADGTPGAATGIRTPDQRLRIFVSSTLKELAAERKAARSAIERLRMAPVMFELGARPHPPRDLYRAYLEQSDVFIGLYGQSYGWVAPGETVSGLEDEYNLAPAAMPKLIYITEGHGERDPRLDDLLTRIKDDDATSFTYVASPDALEEYIESDLATLLAERFDQGRASGGPADPHDTADATASAPSYHLPAPLTEMVGREEDLAAVAGLLDRPAVRLVTLIGPGGIGKSRLALELAGRAHEGSPEGVSFVDLSAVSEPGLVLPTIARALGVRDTGDGRIELKLALALRDRRMLLVLDNFEQVADAAPALRDLLAEVPGLRVLVTSRSLLHVSGEHAYEVPPLRLPDPAPSITVREAEAIPSVALFVSRARAVKPDFELTDTNVEAIARICVALDGVPLALELAAARVRLLPPAAMLARLDRRLSLLIGGVKDLPERQQTLRNTIEWSTALLGDEEKALLAALGVFVGTFSLDAVEYVARATERALDPLAALGTLVDNSLVRQQERDDYPTFSVLSTVREYGLELLEREGSLDHIRSAHARYYVQLGTRVEEALEGAPQIEWMNRLVDDRDNVRAAMRHLLDTEDWDTAALFAWHLYVFWWVGGQLGEVRDWMEEVLRARVPVTGLTRAIALYHSRAIGFWQRSDDQLVPGLLESAELFRQEGNASGEALALISLALAVLAAPEPDPEYATESLQRGLELFRQAHDAWGEAMALVTLGRVALGRGETRAALDRFEESLACARRQHDDLGTTIALYHLAWAALAQGDRERAESAFVENLTVSSRLRHDDGIAYGLEGLVAIAATNGDARRAGRLFGASETLRERTGLYSAPTFALHQHYIDELLSSGAAPDFAAGRAEGRAMPPGEAQAYALSPA